MPGRKWVMGSGKWVMGSGSGGRTSMDGEGKLESKK